MVDELSKVELSVEFTNSTLNSHDECFRFRFKPLLAFNVSSFEFETLNSTLLLLSFSISLIFIVWCCLLKAQTQVLRKFSSQTNESAKVSI